MKKHAKLIKAWADGAEIQVRYENAVEWNDIDIPRWADHLDYRIKPKKDEDMVQYYCVNENTNIYKTVDVDKANLKIIFVGNSHQVKKVLIKNPEWGTDKHKFTEQTEIPLLTSGIMEKYLKKRA